MLVFKEKIVGRANYTLRDYYHDILKNSTGEILTDEERKALEWLNVHDLCKCGHEKQEHSRFINCLFVGCQSCNCEKFISFMES